MSHISRSHRARHKKIIARLRPFADRFSCVESFTSTNTLPTTPWLYLVLPDNMPPSTLTQNIAIQTNGENRLRREVSRSLSMSTSPHDTFHQRKMSTGVEGTSPTLSRTKTGAAPKQLKPFREQDIKILLLENVNQTGRDILQGQGYQVEFMKSSLPEDQLIEKIK